MVIISIYLHTCIHFYCQQCCVGVRPLAHLVLSRVYIFVYVYIGSGHFLVAGFFVSCCQVGSLVRNYIENICILVDGHDSKEDALSCLELIKWKVKEDKKHVG